MTKAIAVMIVRLVVRILTSMRTMSSTTLLLLLLLLLILAVAPAVPVTRAAVIFGPEAIIPRPAASMAMAMAMANS